MSGITPKRKPTTAEKLKISTKKLSARIQQKKKRSSKQEAVSVSFLWWCESSS
jgi:hypothetical protein